MVPRIDDGITADLRTVTGRLVKVGMPPDKLNQCPLPLKLVQSGLKAAHVLPVPCRPEEFDRLSATPAGIHRGDSVALWSPMRHSLLLVLNGTSDPRLLARIHPGEELLMPLRTVPGRPPLRTTVAVDGGLGNLLTAGLEPDLILGDLDSIDADSLARQRRAGIPIEHRPDPGSSDLEKGLAWAATSGASHLDIACWQGTRWDHVLGLFSLLAEHPRQQVRLLDGPRSILVLGAGEHVFRAQPGDGVGLVRFGSTPCRIDLAGLAFPAHSLSLDAGCHGVSNSVLDTEFKVQVSGCPVFLTHTPLETGA